jgi:hypothetical protein
MRAFGGPPLGAAPVDWSSLIDLDIFQSFKPFNPLIYKAFAMWNRPPVQTIAQKEDRMQSAANKPPVSPSRIPQSLLDRFESEWRAMRTTGEAAEKPVSPAE